MTQGDKRGKSIVKSPHHLARFDPKSRRELVLKGLLALSEVGDADYYLLKGEEQRIRGDVEPGMEAVARKHLLEKLMTEGLTRAERLIIVLYHYEEMTVKQISEALDLSESRVSEMHASIMARLRAQMKTGESSI